MNKKLWHIVMLIAVNISLLILIASVLQVGAYALCLGSSGEKVAAVQSALYELGYYGGKISGNYDFATRKTIKIFQRKNGIHPSGEADYETVCALGLDSRSDECFSARTELFARFLSVNAGVDYPDMLAAGEELLKNAGSLPLSRYLFNMYPDFCNDVNDIEPTSQAYAAALQLLR